MGYQAGFHGPIGRTDFLGLRTSRQGSTEIVYDDGANQRLIWRVAGEFGDHEVNGKVVQGRQGPRNISEQQCTRCRARRQQNQEHARVPKTLLF